MSLMWIALLGVLVPVTVAAVVAVIGRRRALVFDAEARSAVRQSRAVV